MANSELTREVYSTPRVTNHMRWFQLDSGWSRRRWDAHGQKAFTSWKLDVITAFN